LGDGAFGCSINPASYRERLWGEDRLTPAAKPSRVVVVGGGPAGLEAARIAALRGHRVTLLEAREQLGGALALWGELPPFSVYGQAVDWWAGELERLGVGVRTGTAATAEGVLALEPDAVILATGAAFSREGRSSHDDRPIPGADRPHVLTPEDILADGRAPKGRVVLLDGEGTHASSGVAVRLAEAGAEVIMLSPGFAPFSMRLNDAFEADFVAERLAAADVEFRPATWARSIGEREVATYALFGGREETITDVEAVVLATGRLSRDGLAGALEGRVAQLFVVGDALAVRPFAAAAYEGQKFARLIGEPDAPRSVADVYFAADDPAVYPTPAG
jgi:NADPH-dependent 2,4-dienoyl-CoA reductase/sulfur reductase-like enzyme